MAVKIFQNVKLPDNAELDEFVIIGNPPRGMKAGELATIIGHNAIIRSHTVIYAGNRIGDRFQTGHHVMIRESNVIGNDVSVGTSSIIEHHVTIADKVRIHSRVFIPEYTVLEEACWLGPGVVITNAKYPSSPGAKASLRGVVIRRGAKIGANATLLPGIEVGMNALIGAGAVVTHDVPAEAVMVGNPAMIINSVRRLPYGLGD